MNVTTEPARRTATEVAVDLDNASGDAEVPPGADFRLWAATALQCLPDQPGPRELSIRLVDEAESAALNSTWRGKSGATNILSFPAFPSFPLPPGLPGALPLLGDLAICVPVVKREAAAQGKAERAHWAHLCVHGVLHLCGFDHEAEAEAAEMESLEVSILESLGFADPYN